jgi:hypothetical protein
VNYRFSGHETFPFRYAWLPKAYGALARNPGAFAEEEDAIVELGVGKNMVRAIRFWVQACGIAEASKGGGYRTTSFGKMIFDKKDGFDPYLEDRRTLWLLHWKLSSHREEPLFAWDYLLNRWPHPELSRTEVAKNFAHQASLLDRKLSSVTLEQHFDVFLHSYVPTKSPKGEILEDNLDCPLIELELIRRVGERSVEAKVRREAIYAFRREPKPDITPELFQYCLAEFWQSRHPHELTLTFRDVSVGDGSPGQIFKLPETDIRQRLEGFEGQSRYFRYQESAALQRVEKRLEPDPNELLKLIFSSESVYA